MNPKYKDKDTTKYQSIKPSDNVGNKHGAIIKPRAEEILLPTVGAILWHVERFLKREGSCLKEVALMATGAFHIKNAVWFCSFLE